MAEKHRMRIAAHSFLWTGEFRGQAHIFAEAAACGFDVLEAAITDPSDVDWTAIEKAKQANGLDVIICAAQMAGLSMASAERAIRDRAVANIVTLMERSRALGANLLTGPIIHPVGDFTNAPADASQKTYLVECLSRLAEHAERLDMRLALEPLNRFQGYLLTRIDQGRALCEAVGSDRLGLLFDLFHVNIEEANSLCALERAAPVCFHIHTSARDRGVPGSDSFDWGQFRATLTKIGYKGDLSVESFFFREPEARRHAHLWHEPALSPLEAAQASIAHLRSIFATA